MPSLFQYRKEGRTALFFMPRSANSVGEIGLDLRVQGQESLRQQIEKTAKEGTKGLKTLEGGFAGAAKKIAGALASAFAVKKIVDFGKASIEAANAASVAETKLHEIMKARMKATAAAEDSTKSLIKATSQMGVVGGTALTTGAQQLASYLENASNLDTLIPAMADLAAQQKGTAATAEDLYNIGNLFGKAFIGQTAMLRRAGIIFSDAEEQMMKYGTEEEKAATLAKVITENVGHMNTAMANTPAGKMAQIKNGFAGIKKEIGYGLLNALMPVLDVITRIVRRLAVLASAFRQFTAKVFGDSSKTGSPAAGIGDITDAADEAAESTEGIGTAAKKAAKDLRSLMGFDKINKLNAQDDDSDTDTATGGGTGTGGGIDLGLNAATEGAGKLSNKIDDIVDRLKEAAGIFKSGFLAGLGSATPKIENIKKSIKSIKDSLLDIATDARVQGAAEGYARAWLYNLGKISGSTARVGLSISNNLISGAAQYLDENKDYIKERIVGIFEGATKTLNIAGNVAAAFGEATEWLNSEAAISITSDIIGIFSDAFLGVTELGVKFGADILDLITRPFVDNAGQISQVITDALGPISECFSTVHDTITKFFDDLVSVYDETVSPFIDDLASDWSELAGGFLDTWTQYFQPVLERLGEKFTTVWQEHIQPVFDAFKPLIEEVVRLIGNLWEQRIKPFLEWIQQTVLPVLAPIFEGIGGAALEVFGVIGDIIGGIIKLLTDVLAFINAVFEGDWSAAWEAIKDIFDDAWESISSIFKGKVNAIIDIVNGLIGAVETMAGSIADALNNISIDMPGWVEDLTGYGSIGFNLSQPSLPRVPYLAQGGYVRANSPRLAMIGDNRHEGEIVAPESKLQAIMEAAVKASGGGGINRQELEEIMNRVVLRMISGMSQIGVYMDKAEVGRIISDEIDKRNARYGFV